jgi:hypothetical protein
MSLLCHRSNTYYFFNYKFLNITFSINIYYNEKDDDIINQFKNKNKRIIPLT